MKTPLTFLAILAATASFGADASADFSIANGNPNGVWSYGYSSVLGGAFNAYSFSLSSNLAVGVDLWTENLLGSDTPSVAKNTLGTSVGYSSVIWQPYQLTMHSGPNGEYSLLRYTAQSSGQYAISTGFIGQDWIFPTNTDVHVLHNGSSIFDDYVIGYQATTGYGTSLFLNTGDTVDVAVGYGSNMHYFGDTTGVEFSVEAVPEPSTLAMVGIAALVARRRRRA